MTRLTLSCQAFFAAGTSFALAGGAFAAPTPATLVVGGKPVPFIVNPYVGQDGQVFAPADAVRLMGADYVPDTESETVTVTGQGGKAITVPYELVKDRYCVPIQKVAQALGASTDWQPTTDTLTVRAKLLMVRQDDGTLSIYTSYPVYYGVQRLDKPSRLFVDLYGLDLSTSPANIPVESKDILHIRSGQMAYNTVRIVIDLKKDSSFKVISGTQTSQVQVALGITNSGLSPHLAVPTPITPPVIAEHLPPTLPTVTPGEGIHITDVSLKTDGPLTQILVSTTGPAKYSTEMLDNPRRLAFDLAGATLDTIQHPLEAVGNPIMKQVRVGVFNNGSSRFGRVVVDLQRMVPFTVTQQPGPDGGLIYAINLQSPLASQPVLGGSLTGKVVVIDPGHGSQDSGAVGIGGLREKDLNLAIGLKLRDTLLQNGATVFMTRADDSFLRVRARPQFAIAHNADLFVSIHCDESGPTNSHSGTTVYFHAQNPICRRLASDISARVGEVSDLPQEGTKSDTIRFATGFGVLRGSPMPAVLVECGYMNDADDLVKLTNADIQQRIAEGIVAGLRDFLAGRTASADPLP